MKKSFVCGCFSFLIFSTAQAQVQSGTLVVAYYSKLVATVSPALRGMTVGSSSDHKLPDESCRRCGTPPDLNPNQVRREGGGSITSNSKPT